MLAVPWKASSRISALLRHHKRKTSQVDNVVRPDFLKDIGRPLRTENALQEPHTRPIKPQYVIVHVLFFLSRAQIAETPSCMEPHGSILRLKIDTILWKRRSAMTRFREPYPRLFPLPYRSKAVKQALAACAIVLFAA